MFLISAYWNSFVLFQNVFIQFVLGIIDLDPVGADDVIDNRALRDLSDVVRLGY